MTDQSGSSARTGRRGFVKGTAALAAGAALSTGYVRRSRAADRTKITFASARFYGNSPLGDLVKAYNEAQGKVEVTYVELPPPSSSTEVHQALVQQLARRTGTPDVFTQDVIWISEFAGAGWSLPLDQYYDAKAQSEFFPGVIEACKWNGELVGFPWIIDSGMLFCRKDLLDKIGAKPPTAYADLVSISQELQKSGDAKFGFLWQGKQAEVLVCNLVEMIGAAGGSILGPDGKQVLIDQPPVIEAVQFMYDTINKTKISPADVLSWDEEPSRRPFTAGQAAFLRNWSYVYPIAQDASQSAIVDKVEVVPLPAFPNGKSSACLGGYQFGVNKATKNPEAAIDFLTWMSTPDTQMMVARKVGLTPTRPAVLESEELVKVNPLFRNLRPVFEGATPRPVTPRYAQVTLALQSAVSRALASGDVEATLKAAKPKIEAITSK